MLIHLVVLFSALPGLLPSLMRGPRAPSRTFVGPDLETNCLDGDHMRTRPCGRRSTARIRLRIRSSCALSNRPALWDVGWWIVANPAENVRTLLMDDLALAASTSTSPAARETRLADLHRSLARVHENEVAPCQESY